MWRLYISGTGGGVQVAMAMASKAKMLLRELKTVRGDLTFLRDRCSQLEEENRRLRESVVKGTRPDEDDLVNYCQVTACLSQKFVSKSVDWSAFPCIEEE